MYQMHAGNSYSPQLSTRWAVGINWNKLNIIVYNENNLSDVMYT